MKPYFFLILIGIALSAMSCKNKTGTADSEPVYDAAVLQEAKVLSLSPDSIPTGGFLFTSPKQMEIVGDSLLVVFNQEGQEQVGHVFSTRGKLLGSFGRLGKGHGEMIFPKNFSIGDDKKTVYFFDEQTSSAVKIPIRDILAGKENPSPVPRTAPEGFEDYRQSAAFYFADDRYLALGFEAKSRIMNVEGGQITDNYTAYPRVADNEEHCWSIWNYVPRWGISPDRKHLVISTYIGCLFEVFSLENGKIRQKCLKAFYEPIYRVAPGAVPEWVTGTEETIYGFYALYCTDKSFWGVIAGEGHAHLNDIYEFGYNGELLRKYRIDGQVMTLAVSPDDVMYLIVLDPDGEQRLKSIDLKTLPGREA